MLTILAVRSFLIVIQLLNMSAFPLSFYKNVPSLVFDLQWRNAWALCKWGPRWWSFVEVPGASFGSSIWMNISPASAGGHHAKMKRPRVSSLCVSVTRVLFFLLLTWCDSTCSYMKKWKDNATITVSGSSLKCEISTKINHWKIMWLILLISHTPDINSIPAAIMVSTNPNPKWQKPQTGSMALTDVFLD